jgi:hypothetical protein
VIQLWPQLLIKESGPGLPLPAAAAKDAITEDAMIINEPRPTHLLMEKSGPGLPLPAAAATDADDQTMYA